MKIFRKIIAALSAWWFANKLRRAGIPKKSNYKIISLGLGIPSTTLYLQSSLGVLQRADFAIFVDSGSENMATYEHLRWLMTWCKQNKGIPIIVIENHGLLDELIIATYGKGIRALTLPGFSKKKLKDRARRSVTCAEKYKADELTSFIRKIYKTPSGKKPPQTEIWYGLTIGLLQRAMLAPVSWQTYIYPFLNIRAKKLGFEQLPYEKIYRSIECQKWLEDHSFPIPPESGCTFCPLQSDLKWIGTKQNDPLQWRRILMLDTHLRRTQHSDVAKLYLHRSCQALAKVSFDENLPADFTTENMGLCGL